MAGRGTDILLEKVFMNLVVYMLSEQKDMNLAVDNQLKGRAGRQGDPGSSQFFLSLEDEMIQRFAGEKVDKLKIT